MGKKKFNTVKAMAWFIIIVMTLSVLGVVGSSFFEDTNVPFETYNEFAFYNSSNSWTATINGKVYAFRNFPRNLEPISLPIDPINWLGTDKIYLGSKPNSEFNVQQQLILLSTIFQTSGIRPQLACTEEIGCPDIPIIDCSNNGVILRHGTETKISQENNCLILSASDNLELQKITERLIYRFLGVMQ